MKHLTFLFFILLFTFSCKKKSSDPAPSKDNTNISNASAPKIYLSYGSGGETVGTGKSFNVNVQTSSNIQKIEIKKQLNSLDATTFLTITSNFDEAKKHIFDVNYLDIENYKKITFYVIATDIKGKSTSVNYSFNPTASTEILSFTGITLGAKDNTTTGSFFSTSSNTVYKPSEVNNTNGATIDIVYNSAGVLRYFLSPNNITGDGFTTIPNATLTKYEYINSGVTVQNFTDMEDDALVRSETVTESSDAFATDALYFVENSKGQKGILHVTNYTTGSTGFVTFDLKLQKYGPIIE